MAASQVCLSAARRARLASPGEACEFLRRLRLGFGAAAPRRASDFRWPRRLCTNRESTGALSSRRLRPAIRDPHRCAEIVASRPSGNATSVVWSSAVTTRAPPCSAATKVSVGISHSHQLRTVRSLRVPSAVRRICGSCPACAFLTSEVQRSRTNSSRRSPPAPTSPLRGPSPQRQQDRIHSDSAFAKLCGAYAVPARSWVGVTWVCFDSPG